MKLTYNARATPTRTISTIQLRRRTFGSGFGILTSLGGGQPVRPSRPKDCTREPPGLNASAQHDLGEHRCKQDEQVEDREAEKAHRRLAPRRFLTVPQAIQGERAPKKSCVRRSRDGAVEKANARDQHRPERRRNEQN